MALAGIDLRVEEGRILGLTGPNGAIPHLSTHDGYVEQNVAGPSIRWRAEFQGRFQRLRVGDHNVPVKHTTTAEGLAVTWTEFVVKAGQTVEVRSED